MSDYSKTRIFGRKFSQVLEIHDVVYQVGQGCPINAKLEFSVENSSRVLEIHDVFPKPYSP